MPITHKAYIKPILEDMTPSFDRLLTFEGVNAESYDIDEFNVSPDLVERVSIDLTLFTARPTDLPPTYWNIGRNNYWYYTNDSIRLYVPSSISGSMTSLGTDCGLDLTKYDAIEISYNNNVSNTNTGIYFRLYDGPVYNASVDMILPHQTQIPSGNSTITITIPEACKKSGINMSIYEQIYQAAGTTQNTIINSITLIKNNI